MSDPAFKEKLKSLNFGRPAKRAPKVTRDELGNVTKEHWDDRVDVTIKSPAIKVCNTVSEER